MFSEKIEINSDKARDLTVIAVRGKVTASELIDTIKTFYESKATTNILWDFSKCNVTNVQAGDISKLVNVARRYAPLRPNGKSAFLVSSRFAKGIGSMYSSLSLLKSSPIANAVFRSEDEALAWLESA